MDERDPGALEHESDKRHTRGTHRVRDPEATLAALIPLLSWAGITRVADLTGFDDVGLPVFQAIRPRGRSLSASQGKGVTPLLSRISAIMEGLEQAHAENITLPTTRATVGALRGSLGYSIEALWTTPLSLLNDDLELDWLEATEVDGNRATHVPRVYVDMDFTAQVVWQPAVFVATSSGLCSGNTETEALTHGLYELIERDAIAAMEATPEAERRRVDPATLTDEAAEILERFIRARNQVAIVDATHDMGVPTYSVRIHSPINQLWYTGSGAHLDSGVALCRAFTEAAQARITQMSAIRDDNVGLWSCFSAVDVRDDPEPTEWVPFRAGLTASPTVAADLRELKARIVARTGVPPIAVTLSQPGIGISVAKVIAPGLREPAAA